MPDASIIEEFNHEKPRTRVVLYLAEHGESSPYQISRDLYQRVTDGYSTITQNLKELKEEGFVEIVRSVPSAKGGEQKLYGLTPLLGFMLAVACTSDRRLFLQRRASNKEVYQPILDGYEVTLDAIGRDRFMKLLTRSLLALRHEIAIKGRKMSLENRERRLLYLFVWPLFTEEANEKEMIKICKGSPFMAGYIQDTYRRTLSILKRSGRLQGRERNSISK